MNLKSIQVSDKMCLSPTYKARGLGFLVTGLLTACVGSNPDANVDDPGIRVPVVSDKLANFDVNSGRPYSSWTREAYCGLGYKFLPKHNFVEGLSTEFPFNLQDHLVPKNEEIIVRFEILIAAEGKHAVALSYGEYFCWKLQYGPSTSWDYQTTGFNAYHDFGVVEVEPYQWQEVSIRTELESLASSSFADSGFQIRSLKPVKERARNNFPF